VPTAYVIDPAQRLVVCTVSGVLTGPELTEHYRAMSADPQFDPCFRQLADLSQVERIVMDSDTVRAEARIPVFAPHVRRAFVAPADAQYGVARMFGLYAEDAGQDVHVFRDLPSAMTWLDASDSFIVD
jgi:hypothetical protein